MEAVVQQLIPLVAPALVAAVIGGLKYLYPKVKEHVPNLFWPFAAFGLAKIGTSVCAAAGVQCGGNPFDFDPATVSALVTAALAMMVRETVKSAPDLKAKLAKVKDVLASK